MRICCVDDCTSKTSKKHRKTIFSFPRNVTEKEKWLRAIPGKLKNNHYICIDHFEESQIKRVDEFGGVRNVYKYPRLVPNAVPSVFDNELIQQQQQQLQQQQQSEQMHVIQQTGPASTTTTTIKTIQQRIEYPPIDISPIINDHIKSFDVLQMKIAEKIDFIAFQVTINESNILIYQLELGEQYDLRVKTSIFIKSDLELIIFHDSVKQTSDDLKGMIAKNLRLVFYSQLQKILNKYSNIIVESNEEILS